MSKFFAGGVSDSDVGSSEEDDLYASSVSESMSESEEGSGSESGSDSASDSESDADSGSESDQQAKQRGPYLRNQFLKGQGSDSDEDSDDEDRKVVKSAKDKVLDEIDADARTIETGRKASDWVSAAAAFDKMLRTGERANRQYATVPLSLVKTLNDLEGATAEKRSGKLNPSNSKALNTVRQRLKKALREYESRVSAYRADPDNYEPSAPLLSQLESKPAAKLGSKVSSPAVSGATPGADEGEAAGRELTTDNVFSTLLSIVETRGKKNTDRQEQVQVLEQLLEVSQTAYQKISVLLVLIPIRFDLTSSGSVMPLASWNAIDANLRMLFEVLESQSEYIVVESAPEVEDIEAGPPEGPAGTRQIPGSVGALVERLDDEHGRALQVIDPHTTEYIERLRDESKLYDLMLRAQCHAEATLQRVGITHASESEALCRLLARRLDHIYYKPTPAVAATEESAWARVPRQLTSRITPRPPADISAEGDTNAAVSATISALCNVLYRQPSTALRTRAVLSLVYHHALVDRYYQARDLLLMSHLQSTIHAADPAAQVLFNRAIVQVGLCAFRCGLIAEALQSLSEICGSSRLKELLGQGPARQDRYHHHPQAPLVELPFHMHINLELIECVYLTCSMLVEVPYLAAVGSVRGADLKKRTLNRPFRRMLDYHDRQVFTGPSENTRDHVIQAAKALQTGDWRKATMLMRSVKVWSLLVADRERILDLVEAKLKIEGLRTWLLTYASSSYSSVAVASLAQQFELSAAEVRQVLVRMIVADELAASLDVAGEYLLLRPEADASRLQTLALALAERTAQLAERNERLATDGSTIDQRTRRVPRPRAA